MKINSVLAGTLAFVLVAGLGTPAFAGEEPEPPFDKNFVHAQWIDLSTQLVPPTNFEFDTNSQFELFDITFRGVGPTGGASCLTIFSDPLTFRCDYFIPNFADNLETKQIKIDIEFIGPGPTGFRVSCVELDGEDEIVTEAVELSRDSQPTHLTLLYECQPNPDFEVISIFKGESTETVLTDVEFWTTTFGGEPPRKVGGELIPIESTALLLAGVQSTTWLIPVVLSVIGIGLFVVSRKSENS